MEERFDICDGDGRLTGETATRSEAHRLGLMHRASHIWIVRKGSGGTELLLQKRCAEKDSFPGCYDISSAGHIQSGDGPLESALRELQEELGIQASEGDLAYAGKFRMDAERIFRGMPFRNHEVSYLYVYTKPVDISLLKLQKSEVESVRWENICAVEKKLEVGDPSYCCSAGGFELLKKWLRENS